ncbi:MAG: hypothetical protein RLZ18_1189 [Actinomycetota bacterium]|jgi:hypothetical protein
MTNNSNFLSFNHIPSLDPFAIAVIDWCVMDGGDVIEEVICENGPFPMYVKGCDIYIGPPTCEDESAVYRDERYFFPHHVVEVASLLEMGTSLPIELLNELVSPLQERVKEAHDGHAIEIEVADMGTDRCIWVVRRFTPEDLESGQFSEMMNAHFALTHDVSDALH